MFKLLHFSQLTRNLNNSRPTKIITRLFLSPAYQCNEVWENRLNKPLFQNLNLDELYHELDTNFQRNKYLSSIDVDVFANGIKDDVFDDELLDLVHKLRLTPETSSSLPSLSYAVIKTLLTNGKKEDLHIVLDDRLNYGIFLDTHLTNILLDHFWLEKDYVSGARIASHLMLQEDPEHPISHSLSLLHCYYCLLNNGEWAFPPRPEEPEDEVKIRVKYLRNDYDDQHFDLKDCKKIIGKTLMYLTKNKNDSLNTSFYILGATLFGNNEEAESILNKSTKNNTPLIKEVLNLLPENSELKEKVDKIKLTPCDLEPLLKSKVEEAIQTSSESDISSQCTLFKQWEEKRIELLKEKREAFEKIERLKKVENLKQELKVKETKLWFFENQEKIELEIEETEELKERESKDAPKYKVKSEVIEEYIPPQVRK